MFRMPESVCLTVLPKSFHLIRPDVSKPLCIEKGELVTKNLEKSIGRVRFFYWLRLKRREHFEMLMEHFWNNNATARVEYKGSRKQNRIIKIKIQEEYLKPETNMYFKENQYSHTMLQTKT